MDRILGPGETIGASLNAEKTRMVRMKDPGANFAFLGYVVRWVKGHRTGRPFACVTPRPDKVAAILRRVREILRRSRHLPMPVAVARVNEVVRGWVGYFRVGNGADALRKVQNQVERKVRRFAARKSGRKGFGWRRWSSEVVYGGWGLYDDYRVRPLDLAKVGLRPSGTITSV